MKHLWEDWPGIRRRIQGAQNLILFLDYDGTLAPIAATPDLAFCPPEAQTAIMRLRDLPKVSPVIISGRSLEDIREKVGVPNIIYVGNHGLEIGNPAGTHKKKLSAGRQKEYVEIGEALKASLEGIPGILFEDKGPILTIHFRNAPPEYLPRIHQVLDEALAQWQERWKIAYGKMVFEIRPKVDFDKGKAVKEILRTSPTGGALPIYLGDDQTDQGAFREIKGKGITVFVGDRQLAPGTDYYLKDSSEVVEFLHRSLEILSD
jgi:trehalose 6-phosphate phosphatase